MQAKNSQSKSNPSSFKVLLVEDEGLIARDIAQRLETLGHRVVAIASTAEEAVASAAGAEIVLMDIRLDGHMDGIQAAEIIRREFGIPVIFLTAHADRATLERAKQAEPFGYIVKPVAPAALHTSIEIAVYKHAMEREVAEREAWLTAILGSVADAVAVGDVEGRVRILNPAAESLTGWNEDDAVGEPLEKVIPLTTYPLDSSSEERTNGVPAEDPVPLAMLRDRAVSLGREAQLLTRGGRTVPVEGTAAPVRIGARAIGGVLSFRDVGQRRWEEQQLRQSQRVEAAARLAAGVADEYTALLSVIRTQAERILEQFADYSPVRTSAEEIRQAASAAEQITRKLAGFGKRRLGKPEVLSPNAVLRRMAKLLETVAGAIVKVVVRPGLHTGKIRADEGQFEQLLMNLTMHAGRLSAEGGEVRIETGSATKEIDGFPAAFARVAISYMPAAGSRAPHNLEPEHDESLALSVAHNVATEHEGFFSVQRAADGSDCLEVLIPRWTEPAAAGATAPASLTDAVLLVEPRENVRAELHKYFEANGYNLLEAVSAEEAVTLAEMREGALDLVIASFSETAQIREALRESHPDLATLAIVEGAESRMEELRRSYTQTALLERVRILLEAQDAKRNEARRVLTELEPLRENGVEEHDASNAGDQARAQSAAGHSRTETAKSPEEIAVK